jgi:hypothetical protein
MKVAGDTVVQGANFCLPVTVTNFTTMGSFQHSLMWNPQVISYQSTQGVNLIWSAANSSFNQPVPGTLLVAWSDLTANGASLANGTTIYNVCFKAVGANGSQTDIIMGGQGFPPTAGTAEAYTITNQNVWSPAQSPISNHVLINNSVSVQETAMRSRFRVFPNPVAESANVCFQQQKAGKAAFSLTDELGRVVWEEEMVFQSGDICEVVHVPASVVSGQYVLLVQTADGQVLSQALTVAR